MFLKEFNYIEEEQNMIRHITNGLKFSSDDSDEFDEE